MPSHQKNAAIASTTTMTAAGKRANGVSGNNIGGNEVGDLLGRQTQQTTEDRLVCLAHLPRRSLYLAWRGVQPYRHPWMFQRAGFRMREGNHEVASAQVDIAPEVFARLHHASRDTCLLQEPHGLVWRALPRPGADESIQLIVPLPAL